MMIFVTLGIVMMGSSWTADYSTYFMNLQLENIYIISMSTYTDLNKYMYRVKFQRTFTGHGVPKIKEMQFIVKMRRRNPLSCKLY